MKYDQLYVYRLKFGAQQSKVFTVLKLHRVINSDLSTFNRCQVAFQTLLF